MEAQSKNIQWIQIHSTVFFSKEVNTGQKQSREDASSRDLINNNEIPDS